MPLNVPSSVALSNPPPTPTVSILATPLPPIVQPIGHTHLGPIGPTSQPPTSSCVPHRRPNNGNQHLSMEHYYNALYVPYPRGVTIQWD